MFNANETKKAQKSNLFAIIMTGIKSPVQPDNFPEAGTNCWFS